MKFRKKPVVIEAVRLTPHNVEECIAFCGGKLKSHLMVGVVIETREGNMTADVGDWIIKGVAGEFYPCKPDIFEKTYEPETNANRTIRFFCRCGREIWQGYDYRNVPGLTELSYQVKCTDCILEGVRKQTEECDEREGMVD